MSFCFESPSLRWACASTFASKIFSPAVRHNVMNLIFQIIKTSSKGLLRFDSGSPDGCILFDFCDRVFPPFYIKGSFQIYKISTMDFLIRFLEARRGKVLLHSCLKNFSPLARYSVIIRFFSDYQNVSHIYRELRCCTTLGRKIF